MANFDVTNGLNDGNFQTHMPDGTISRIIDMSKANAGAPIAVGDTLDIITIPPNFVIEDVYAKVLTTGTATSTFTLGNSTTAAAFIGTSAADAAAGTIYKNTGATASGLRDATSVATLAGKASYSLPTASTIRLAQATASNVIGKIQVWVRGFQL